MASQASHWGGGEISYKCVGFGQYVVTTTLYGDCSGVSPDAYVIVQYQSTCGNGGALLPMQAAPQNVSPICPAAIGATTCSGGSLPGVSKVVYSDTVTLPGNCTNWQFYMVSCCRNNSTINIANAFNTDLALMSWLDNETFYCNSSPRFLNPAVAYAQMNQPFVYDPRAVDDDGDRLVFSLVAALQSPFMPVFYNMGLSGIQPIMEPFTMNPATGRLSFTPFAAPGDYIITYKIDEYRNNVWIGATQREVRITKGNFGLQANAVPADSIGTITGATATGGDTMYVCTGQPMSFNLFINDTDPSDSIRIIYYDVYNNCPGASFNIAGLNPVVGSFNWTPTQPGIYTVGFIIQDPKCPIIASHQYRPVTIIVQNTSPIIGMTDQFLCSSPSITLLAGGTFSSYLWSTGETTQFITVTSADVYSLTTTGVCGTASDSVEVFEQPEVQINGGNLTDTIVLGDSTQLFAALANGLASDLYFNKDTAHIIPKGGVTTVSLWTENIFPTILAAGSVVDVCFDISQVTAGELDIYLVAPNSAMITLSTNKGSAGTFSNTCFSINATDLITNYATSVLPTDSSFVPQGNWANLNGSTATNEWQLAIRHENGASVDGLLNRFSIQFGGGYDYVWTPNNDGSLSCTTCPNPIASPETTTTYIVEMNNGANCISFDTITVVVLRPEPIDTVYFDIAEDSTILLCANFPSGMGAVSSSTILNAPNNGTLSTSGLPANCINYTASSPAEITDTVIIAYCDNQGFCDTTVYIITIVSCVWAGDTDTDQFVNNYDLLPIGLGYGQTGVVRPNADLLFDCEPNRNWNSSTPVTNIDFKHSDCDGNGTVNDDDTMAIVLNWGQFYVKSSSSSTSSSTTAVPFYTEYYQTVPGATIFVPIMLGDSTNPVDSAYGVAFTINYDETMVDTNSVSVDFSNSWFGQINNDMISVSKNFHNQGEIQVGLTRINHIPRNGFGQIGLVQMTIKDDIIKKSANIHLNMHIDNVRLITDQEVEIPTTIVYTYVLILDTLMTGQTNIQDAATLSIFPNPASSVVHLQSDNSKIQQLQVLNMAGQLVLNQNVEDSRTTFSVADFVSGVYILQVQTDKGIFNKKIVVRQP